MAGRAAASPAKTRFTQSAAAGAARLGRAACRFLEILLVKPGALAGSTALAAARAEGGFTSVHEAFWTAARTAHGDAKGTRALIEVLLLYWRMNADAVLAGMSAALQAGSTSPELVAIEARKNTPPTDEQAASGGSDNHDDLDLPTSPGVDADPEHAALIALRPRRALPEDTRPLPSVAVYDQLLSRSSKGPA